MFAIFLLEPLQLLTLYISDLFQHARNAGTFYPGARGETF